MTMRESRGYLYTGNNTFGFAFQFEKDQDDKNLLSLDVWQSGEWVAHHNLNEAETKQLADFLTTGGEA